MIDKKGSKFIFNSSKIMKDIYDAEYDLSQLQIVTVDGIFPFIDAEEARLLFFHNIPSVSIHNDEKERNLNKCLVEIRITISTLKMIIEILNYELKCLEQNQSCNEKEVLKKK